MADERQSRRAVKRRLTKEEKTPHTPHKSLRKQSARHDNERRHLKEVLPVGGYVDDDEKLCDPEQPGTPGESEEATPDRPDPDQDEVSLCDTEVSSEDDDDGTDVPSTSHVVESIRRADSPLREVESLSRRNPSTADDARRKYRVASKRSPK